MNDVHETLKAEVKRLVHDFLLFANRKITNEEIMVIADKIAQDTVEAVKKHEDRN